MVCRPVSVVDPTPLSGTPHPHSWWKRTPKVWGLVLGSSSHDGTCVGRRVVPIGMQVRGKGDRLEERGRCHGKGRTGNEHGKNGKRLVQTPDETVVREELNAGGWSVRKRVDLVDLCREPL